MPNIGHDISKHDKQYCLTEQNICELSEGHLYVVRIRRLFQSTQLGSQQITRCLHSAVKHI